MDTTTATPQTARPRTYPNFRPPIFWKEVRERYLNGEASTRTLAQEYGISISTLQARCRREGWVEERAIHMEY
jgi:hypothetical protein